MKHGGARRRDQRARGWKPSRRKVPRWGYGPHLFDCTPPFALGGVITDGWRVDDLAGQIIRDHDAKPIDLRSGTLILPGELTAAPERVISPAGVEVFERMCEALGIEPPDPGIRIYPEDLDDDD